MGPAAVHVIDDLERAAAILHPLRLRILRDLAQPESAAGLARRIGLPRQQLNYHLRQLEEEGLIVPAGERRQRNCTERLFRAVARSYVISPATLGALSVDPAPIRDQVSSAYLLAAASEMLRDVASLRDRADRMGKRVPTLTLQTEVRFAAPETQRAFAEELSAELARLVARYHDEATPGGRRFRVVLGAYPSPVEPAAVPERRSHE